MKKIIALLLALTLALGMVACANNDSGETTAGTTAEQNETAGETTEEVLPEPVATTKALEIFTTIWNALSNDQKFPAMGGDINHVVDGAPGLHNLADEGLINSLLVPAAEVGKIDEAASLINAMMINNFAGGVFHVSGDAKAFAESMHDAITTNRWMCGMPEKMVIAVVEGEYVLAMYGLNDFVNPLETQLTTAYADAEVLYSEAIPE